MNRVAAQNARDRKKAYVEDLELKVALLEEQVCESQRVCVLDYHCLTYRTKNYFVKTISSKRRRLLQSSQSATSFRRGWPGRRGD